MCSPSEPKSCLKEPAYNDGGIVEGEISAGAGEDTKESFLTLSVTQSAFILPVPHSI